MVLENKLEPANGAGAALSGPAASPSGRPLVDRPLRIGWFGVLRDAWAWQVLEALAIARPAEIEIVVAGIPIVPADLPQRAQRHANVRYLGTYRSPLDLPALYGRVDLVWGCYPYPGPGHWNWRWARTNRFYESCYFRKPLIVLAGSGDADEVRRHGLGLELEGPALDPAVNALAAITCQDLAQWHERVAQLPTEVFTYSTESATLVRALTAICSARSVGNTSRAL